MDPVRYNREAWDRAVAAGNRWTVPVTPEEVAAAARGEVKILLTPDRPVPAEWFPPLAGLPTLCLASGGGQQGPLLAAAGARVTVFDNSPAQLARDREVAAREGLVLETVQGDMRDLSAFPAGAFGLVVNPCSTCFVPEVRRVWREAARVLRPGGLLLAGFVNPALYLVGAEDADRGDLRVTQRLPYADIDHASPERLRRMEAQGEPLEFSHTLEDLLAGQLAAGLVLEDLYEDGWESVPLARFMKPFLATRARKAGVPSGSSG